MENRSDLGQAQDQTKIGVARIKADVLDRGGGAGGGLVAKLRAFAASSTTSRAMGWSTCNLFYNDIYIIPRVLITNVNRVCIEFLHESHKANLFATTT